MNVNKLALSLAENPKKWLAFLTVLIFLVLTVYEGYRYWQVISASAPVGQPVVIQQPKAAALTSRSPLFTQSLFGVYVPAVINQTEIKQSQLDVEIVGIMYAANEAESQVIIRSAAGEEKFYVVGDELPGGAVIKKITKQGIVVLHNGALESLSLPKNELIFNTPAKPLIEEK